MPLLRFHSAKCCRCVLGAHTWDTPLLHPRPPLSNSPAHLDSLPLPPVRALRCDRLPSGIQPGDKGVSWDHAPEVRQYLSAERLDLRMPTVCELLCSCSRLHCFASARFWKLLVAPARPRTECLCGDSTANMHKRKHK